MQKKMGKLGKNEMMQLNPKTKIVFGTSAKNEGYLVLSSALDFRNLKLPKGWKIDARGLTDEKTAYTVFIKEVLVAGPKVGINKKQIVLQFIDRSSSLLNPQKMRVFSFGLFLQF